MTSEIQTTSAVDPQVAGAMAVYDRLAPLKDALGLKDFSDPELQLFAMVAYQTGLDPFSRQIYAIKRQGKVSYQTGIDGYRTVAESKGGNQYAGSEEAEYEPCDCNLPPAGHPKIARVVVHRILPTGHVVNQTGVARWHELYPGDGDVGLMWRKMPFNQLAKCAEANALRKAFPRVLGGVYIEEEMAQAGPTQNAELLEAAAKPKAAERIAARRAALEGQIIEPTPANIVVDDFPQFEVVEPPTMSREDFIERGKNATPPLTKAQIEWAGDQVAPGKKTADLTPAEWHRMADLLGLLS